MADPILPLAPMEKLLKKGSPDMRVSEPAKEVLREVLEEYAVELARNAAKFAEHAGRKTFKDDDVRLAAKHQK